MKTLLSLAVLALLLVGCSQQTNPFASKIPNGRYEGVQVGKAYGDENRAVVSFDSSDMLMQSIGGSRAEFEVKKSIIYKKGQEWGKIQGDGSILVFGFPPNWPDFVIRKVAD